MVSREEAWDGSIVSSVYHGRFRNQYLLPSGVWYDYVDSTPNRHRGVYPNLEMEVLKLVREGENRTKNFIISVLRNKGRNRYVVDEKEIRHLIDLARVAALHDNNTNRLFMPKVVYDGFVRGQSKVIYRNVTYENEDAFEGVGAVVYADVSGTYSFYAGGVNNEGREFSYRSLKKLLLREDIGTDWEGALEELRESFAGQASMIKYIELAKLEVFDEGEIAAGSDNIEVTVDPDIKIIIRRIIYT